MLDDRIINVMTVDELRNYICHLQEENDKLGDLNFARSELAEALQRAYNCKDYELNCVYRLNHAQGDLGEVNRELHEKYKEFLPKPVTHCMPTCLDGENDVRITD